MAQKKERPPDDLLTAQLRAAARKQSRGSLLLGIPLALAFCGGPLALLVWLVYPRPTPPPIVIVAFDQCAAAGSKVSVQAQIIEKESRRPVADSEAIALRFQDAAHPEHTVTVRTNALGVGAATWPVALRESKTIDFVVQYAGEKRRRSDGDRARLYALPADSSPLLVPVEALTDSPQWQQRNPLDIKPGAGAGAALREIARRRPIIYLAAADSPWTYRRIRVWAVSHFHSSFPPGAILGIFADAEKMSPHEARASRAAEIKRQFTGETRAVATDRKTAEAFAAQRIRTFFVGKTNEVITNVERCDTWADLPED